VLHGVRGRLCMLRVGNVEIHKPVIVSSGPLSRKIGLLKQAEAAGCDAAMLKLTFVSVPFPGQMRSFSVPGRTIVSPIDRRLDIEEGCELARQARVETNLKVFANLGARGDQLDNWKILAERFAAAGVHGLELNFCCPNLDTTALEGKRVEHGGSQIGENPDTCYKITEMVRKLVNLPIICKFLPNAPDVREVGRACQEAGADAVHVVGLPTAGLPPVDPTRPGAPDMPLIDNVAFGGSNGTICKYSTFMATAQLARAIDIPIIASGGLEDWRDFVSVVMWGASGVGLCSAIMWYGWRLVKELNEDLADYMARHGFTDWQDFRGLALPRLTTPDKLVVRPGVSRIDCDVCIGCGRCTLPGHCDAIEMKDGKAAVDEELCIGCGVCQRLCPVGAIVYVFKEQQQRPG
jgi:dihydroorotate dehydrogenase/Pyruvate/2-oxoacid:ferredoxin oxidoreductase delta subunit